MLLKSMRPHPFYPPRFEAANQKIPYKSKQSFYPHGQFALHGGQRGNQKTPRVVFEFLFSTKI